MEEIKILTAEADNGTFTFEIADQEAREEIAAIKESLATVEETVTASGTFLTVTDAGAGERLRGFKVYGTLDPIDSLGINMTGRNMLGPATIKSVQSGVTCTQNDDGSFTQAQTGEGSVDYTFATTPMTMIYPAGTYFVCPKITAYNAETEASIGGVGDGLGYALTLSVPWMSSAGGYSYFTATQAAANSNSFKICPQIVLGGSSDYASFVGGTTAIDLQGYTLAALEDGTRDELTIDKNGAVTLTKNTDAGQVIDLGYIVMPAVPEDEKVHIWANTTKTPTIEATYALPSAEGPVVLYTAQTLTEAQQEQARKNIGIDALGGSTDYSAYGLPVLHLTGDTTGMSKDDAVTLAYEYDNMGGTCTVKWQGSSSIAYPKKNYTIKFDQEFEAVEGWGAEKKYCFKANYIDHSHARNVVGAKLWGQIVKSRDTVPERMANLVNAGAVDGFPCIIMLNGEFHGLYTWNIPKDGWMMGMSDETAQEAILCANTHCTATQFKGAAVCDGTDFDVEYVANEDDAAWVATSVNTLIQACINSNGSDLDTTVAQYLDWDSAIDYYIYVFMLRGGDMVDKNYLLVTFDGVKLYFSAYDIDSTFGLAWDGKTFDAADSGVTPSICAGVHRVFELIKTYKKDALKARYAELRAGALSEDNVALVFNKWAAGIPSPLLVDDVRKWPTIPSSSASNTAQVVSWYERRCKAMDAAIEAL